MKDGRINIDPSSTIENYNRKQKILDDNKKHHLSGMLNSTKQDAAEGRLDAGNSSVLDVPIEHHPWMNPGFGLHSQEAEYVNNEMKRLAEAKERYDNKMKNGNDEVSFIEKWGLKYLKSLLFGVCVCFCVWFFVCILMIIDIFDY